MVFVYVVVALAVGLGLGYVARRYLAKGRLASAERETEKLLRDARREAETIVKEARLEAKDEVHRVRTEVDSEVRERRAELVKSEQRVTQREELIEARALELDRRDQSMRDREAHTAKLQDELKELHAEQLATLERVSGLSAAQAKEMLLKQTEDEARHEMARMVRAVEEDARREADRRARNILSLSIQRTAANHVAETTVSVVTLPSDDMKGRIIGREGRNIRALEGITGIDFIIDDTPEAVVLSGFDGVRREIARLTLTKLIVDGRIHPARVEETYNQAKAEVEAVIEEAGEQACFDTNIHGLAPELVRTLGRLKFRTSYGQNVMNHSIEVAHLAGIMASELGANPKVARRAGLLHDIGKAIDHEVEGCHPAIGANFLKRFNESPVVLNAVAGHHGDMPPDNPYTPLISAADAISASRPGARRETLERYIKRLEKLEEIANAFPGVENAYAIQAGREIRVIVGAEKVDDASAMKIARDIANKIESEMTYPGEIQVTLLRELRCIEYAK